MKASELRDELQAFIDTNGDLEIICKGQFVDGVEFYDGAAYVDKKAVGILTTRLA